MKRSNNSRNIKISRIRSKLLQTGILALSLAMIFSTVSCSQAKADEGRTVSADEAYFSSVQLDLSSAIEGEYASIESVRQFRDKIGILLFGTSQYYIQLYDNDGQVISQTALEDAINPASNLVDMADDADGNLHVLTQLYDETTEKVTTTLFAFDLNGALIGKPLVMPIEELVSQSQMKIDNQGNIYWYFTSDSTNKRGISVFNSNGTQLYDIPEPNGINFASFLLMDDQMYTAVNDYSSGVSKFRLYPLDNKEEKLGTPIDYTNTPGSDGGLLSMGFDGLYSINAKGVYSVSLDDQKTTPVFLWDNTNFKKAANNTDQVIVLSARKTIVVKKAQSGDDSIDSVSLLTRAAKNPDAGKKIIAIAGCMVSLDSAVSAAVNDFNMNSKEYRVEIHEYYGNPAISSNTNNVISTMNLEILSGDAPDIIYGDIQLFTNYENKGMLVDLYSLMKNDSVFNKDDVIPSILKICEKDGHLYKLGTGFWLNDFIGAKSIIGDRTGWTIDEFNSFAESLPDKVAPIIGYTQSELLSRSLSNNMNSFVDSKSGTVRFDSDDFRKLLDYAKTYGEADSDTNIIRPNSVEMIANGELAMYGSGINSPMSYAQEVVIFGEPISVTGYPSSERSTAACCMPSMLAIYSGSDNKEAAWEFFKYFYTEKAQKALESINMIPVLTSVFEEQIETELNPDPNAGGMRFLDKAGNPVPMSAEMAEGYRNLIYGLNLLVSYDSEIQDIVMEEVPPYFNNQKSQDDVIALIQERVQTLVDERQ